MIFKISRVRFLNLNKNLVRYVLKSFLFILILFGVSGVGCTNSILLEWSEIRQSPNLSERENFIVSNQFQSQRQPNIYLIFFDTLRPDFALGQNGSIKKFYEQSLTFETAYGTGTATWYSMFSLFHGSPSFVAYDLVPRVQENTDYYGSIFFKVFNKLGYKVDTYGNEWTCDVQERPSGTSWKRFLMTYFGWKSRLLDRCQSDPNYDTRFSHAQDELTVEELEKKLPTVITSPTKHLSFITFNNNHTPYKWGAATTGISKNVGRKEDFSDVRTTSNRYYNTVVATDINFDRLMKLINTLPGHEDAIVVLFSDHGEMLYEKKRESGHGGIPYKEKIEIVLGIQFPESSGLRGKKDTSTIASIADIFPTVLDYLSVTPKIPSEWLIGHSLLNQSRNSLVINRTNLSDPTRDMVLVNRHQKAWIHVDESDFYHSKSMRLKGFTDLNDREIENVCENKSPEECKQYLMMEFPEAIKELYPDQKF